MSRRVARSRNVLRVPRFLAVLVAVTAVVVGTVAPVELATASASVSASTSQARSLSDPAKSSIVKTSLAGFNAGNIISDAVFTNKSTMTEAQIQSFFNSKVSKCVVGKDEDGKPYVCLKDFKITSVNRQADAYCSGYKGAANESAARIIYRVAQACNINPQVLIVMLQKEQGLVTHVWPSAWRYNIALGQGCPDTAPCDPNYIGFFHQIYGAARQMQIYMEGRWFQWYAPGKTWGILYHPNASCGRGNVYVANKATAALYYYTPYQPNAAAMRAGYGEGDGCSSYGNRNFYNYFTDWFGSTQAGTPTVTVPALTDINSTSYVASASSDGVVWGYPYLKSTWGSRVQLASGMGALTDFFSVGDLDGDGRRDFIAVNTKLQPSVLYGRQGATLSAPAVLAGDWAGVTAIIPAGDFNGDGIEDLLSRNAKGDLFLRKGNGLGGFAAPARIGNGWGTMNLMLGGSDFDGNGTSDLVARDVAGNLYLYPGNGRGSWGRTVKIGKGWSSMTDIFIPGDFNGDKKNDILAHGADGQLLLYKGLGAGGLSKVGVVGGGWQTMVTKASSGSAIRALPALSAGMGDLDGASGNDVVAMSRAGEAFIYGGTGGGSWRGTTRIAAGWSSGDTIVTMGDFDRSGRTDLGRIDPAGNFYMYAGKAGGGVSDPVRIGGGWGVFTQVIGGVDFDGDRRSDVLAVDANGVMYLYRGNGAAGWAGARVQVGNGWGVVDQVFYAGDFNGDGRGDVIARWTDGTLRMYPITGNGGWGAPVQIGNGWGSFAKIFSPGDFDGNGKSDILGVDARGLMYLYPGLGNGTFGAKKQIGNGWQTMPLIG